MRVLIVTGTLAEESVRRYASEAGDVDVIVLPIPVAAFIAPEYAAKALRGLKAKDYDVILMPGYTQGDVTPVEAATGVPTFKGPLHAADIPTVLGLIGEVELSKTIPASELIRDALRKKTFSEIREVERNWRRILKEKGGLVIGGEGYEVPIGRGFPMRVMAEIVNAPTLDEEAIRSRAKYFEAEGADIIDIGMLAGKPNPEKVEGIVKAVRTSVNRPISIDTLDLSEIKAAVEAGVDLVLSVDSGNLEDVAAHISDVPAVVLPTNMKEGGMPRGAEERVAALRSNLDRARALGLRKLIGDPVIEPAINPGLMESLNGYRIFRQIDQETPMLFGVGNVSELIDVDSQGVNGLLTALACEVDADLLFVPEFSPKARGSVRETVTASKMMFLAERRRTVPKDLGVDLLILKEKRRREEPYQRDVEGKVVTTQAEGDESFVEDHLGWFKIGIDREEEMIAAIHYPKGMKDPDILIKGRGARELYQTILRMRLVGKLDHAAYLGKELEKAEIALRTGRSYVQDEDLFP